MVKVYVERWADSESMEPASIFIGTADDKHTARKLADRFMNRYAIGRADVIFRGPDGKALDRHEPAGILDTTDSPF